MMRRITRCTTGCTTKAAAAAVAVVASLSLQHQVINYYCSARRTLTMKLIHSQQIPSTNIISHRPKNSDTCTLTQNVQSNKQKDVNSKSSPYGSNNNNNRIERKANNYHIHTNSKVMPYHKVSRGRLAIIRPDLIDEWIPQLNAVDVTSVQCSSHVSVWWRCKMCKSKYSAAVRERVVKESRCCPYCHGTGKMAMSDNDAQKEQVEDVHRTESNSSTFTGTGTGDTQSRLTVNDARANADEQAKQKVAATSVESKLTKQANDKQVSQESVVSLTKSHPHLVKYWDVTRNGTLTPQMFNASSIQSVWWTVPYPLNYCTNKNHVQQTAEQAIETDKSTTQFVTFRRPIATFVVDQMSLQEKLQRSDVLQQQVLRIFKKTVGTNSSSQLQKLQLLYQQNLKMHDSSNNVHKHNTQRNEANHEQNDNSEATSMTSNVLQKERNSIMDWWQKRYNNNLSQQQPNKSNKNNQQQMLLSSSLSNQHIKNKKQTQQHITLHADDVCFVNSSQRNKLRAARVRGAIREELLNRYVQTLAQLQQPSNHDEQHGVLGSEGKSCDVNIPLLILLANTQLSSNSVSDDQEMTKKDDDDNGSGGNNGINSSSQTNVMRKVQFVLQNVLAKRGNLLDVNVQGNTQNTLHGTQSQSTNTSPVMSFTSLKLPNAAALHRSFPQLPSSLFSFTSSSSLPQDVLSDKFAFPTTSTSSLHPEASAMSVETLLYSKDMSPSSSNEAKPRRSAFAVNNEKEQICRKYPQLRKWMPRLFDKSLFTQDAPVQTIFAQQHPTRRQSKQYQQQGSQLPYDALDQFSNYPISASSLQQQQRNLNKRSKNFILCSDVSQMWDEEPLLAQYHRATFVSQRDPRIKFYHDAEEGDIDLASQLRVSGAHDNAGAEQVQTQVYDKRSLVGDAMAGLGSNPTLEEDLKALSYVREVMQEVRYPDYRSLNIHSLRNDSTDSSSEANLPGKDYNGPRRTQRKPRVFRLQLPASPLPVSFTTLQAPREPRKVAKRKKRAAVHEKTGDDSSASADDHNEAS